MSVSAVAPTPFYHDPERLQIAMPQAAAEPPAEGTAADGKHLSMFAAGDDEPSFWDLLDVINPLQHIPVVSTLYRELTGDQIGVGARLTGGALFGGPIGLIASAVDCMVEETTGKTTGDHVLALFQDDQPTPPDAAPATRYAQAEQPAPATAPQAAAEATTTATTIAAAAPVITLPPAAGSAAAQPLVFTLDGLQAGSAPASAGPVLPPADVNALQALAEPKPANGNARPDTTRPLPLTAGAARVMPTPARNPNANGAPQPPITVPVSTSSARSNTPITGRSPTAASVTAAPRPAVGQEKLGNHPMLPPTDANGQTAAGPDWFSAAWGQALDKYQRANQRNDKAGSGDAAATSTLQ